jgi:hypothetical protein
LVSIWGLRLALLGLLQVTTHTGVGLKVWPVGEDQNWLCLMRDKPGLSLPRTFWALDSRNPLSVWWYVAAKPLLLEKSGYGFFMVRRTMDLCCALCVLLLVYQLGRGGHGFFSFSCALITQLWNFSWRFDNVVWVFLGALCLSLLSLWAYCKYVDTDRKKGRYLALSLIFYLLAIGTYTLQASAFLAVIVLALFRPPGSPADKRAWRKRALRALGDASLFAAVCAIFLLFWVTCSFPWGSSMAQTCSLSLLTKQLRSSLEQVIWHPGTGNLLKSIGSTWKVSHLMGAALGGMVFFGMVLGRIAFAPTGNKVEDTIRRKTDRSPSHAALLGYLAAVILGISAMTIALESISPIWFPGTRTPMLEQVLQPLLYGGALLGLTALVSRFPRLARAALWVGATAICSGVFLVGLEYNRLQVMTTGIWKKRLVDAVRDLGPYTDKPLSVILKIDPVPDRCYDLPIAQHYIQKHFHSKSLNLVVLQKRSAVSGWMGFSAIAFRPDDQGISMMGANGRNSVCRYNEVILAQRHNDKTTLLTTLGMPDLEGYEATFARSQPIAAAELPLMRAFEARLQRAQP